MARLPVVVSTPTLVVSGALALLVLATPRAAAADDPFFTGLANLPGGVTSSIATGVSGDGGVVCGVGFPANHSEAFRWTAQEGLHGIGDVPGGITGSSATAISADGSTIVGNDSDGMGLDQSFRWTASTGLVGMGFLSGPQFYNFAHAVNLDGSVVTGQSFFEGLFPSEMQAYRWVLGSGMTLIGDIPGADVYGDGTGVSGDGSRICGYSSSVASGGAGFEAALWTNATGMVGLGDLANGAFSSSAFAISLDGTTVVGFGSGPEGQGAVRWTDPAAGGDGLVFIGELPGGAIFGQANGVSADGSVIVGKSVVEDGSPRAFIWFEGQGIFDLRDVLALDLGLNLEGWTLVEAKAVSADGRTVVGWGYNVDHTEGWVAHLGGAPWTNVGHGLAGTHGVPLLNGLGAPTDGNLVRLTLSGARPGSSAALIVGLSQVLVPLKGGVLVPSPDLLLPGFPVGADGKFVLPAIWPPGMPPGLTLTFQYWIVDADTVQHFSASNGLAGVTQ